MAESFGQQPVEFITQITTMNSNSDSTSLKPNEAALIQNFTKRRGVFEVRTGRTSLNAASQLPAACYGLSTFRPYDTDTINYVAVSNGVVYGGSTFPLTSQLTGLTSATLMKLEPFNGRMLINDPLQGIAWFDGTSAGWCGIPSPAETKLVDDFESTSGWIGANGTCAINDSQVIHGRHGLIFTANSGATYSPAKTITPVNLTVFPSAPFGDGTASSLKDYLHLQLTRSFKADFTYLDLWVASSGGASYCRISDLPEWQDNDGAGLTFDIYMRKSEFISYSGTLDWSAITLIEFAIAAATGKSPFIIVDWLRLERGGPVAQEYGKVIGDFEPDETWTVGAGTVTWDYKYKTHLSRSIVIGQNANAYRTYSPVLDLTTVLSGVPADDIDVVMIKLARNYLKTSGTFTIAFTDTAGAPVTASYIINAVDILTPRIGSTPDGKLTDHSLNFQTFYIRKDQFTNGGTVNWASLVTCTLTSSNTAGTYYVDQIGLVKEKDQKLLFSFEPTETIPTVTNALKYGWADPNKDPHRSDEGSSTSLFVKIKPGVSCTIDIPFSPDIDLSAYASGAASQLTDLLGLYIWMSSSANIDEIDLLYDSNDGAFTSYYIKKLTRTAGQIPAIINNWFEARFSMAEHDQQPASGATGTWANIDKIRLVITTNKNIGGVTLYLDQWLLKRGATLSGNYWYAVTYKNNRGARSDLSVISNSVNVTGGMVMLTNIPVTTGQIREVWRLGGLTTEWKLVGVIGDDQTTYFEDNISEEELGEILPSVNPPPLICKTFCIYENILIRANLTELSGGYRYKTMVMVGNEDSIDEADPLNSFDLGKDDGFEILALIPFNDRVFILKEKGIASFNPYDLTQKPVWYSREIGILSPFSWAVDPNGVLYFIGSDLHIYSFNGSTFDLLFSDPIDDYTGRIPASYVSKVVGIFYDSFAIFSMPQTGETVNTTTLLYDTLTQMWGVFTNWGTSIFHQLSYSGNNKLIGGTETDGQLHQYFSGDTDNGTVISGVIQTGDRSPDPTITSQPISLYCTAVKLTSTDATIKVEPYFDLVDSTNDLILTINSLIHNRETDGVSSPGYFPTYLGWKITTGLARVALRSLAYSRRDESRK